MELYVYLAFVAATVIMIALPGPSVILTVAHSISFGWRRALCTVAGATAGIAVQLLVAAVGLASLLHTVAGLFEWLRWAGAAYLVYLGIRQWQSAGSPLPAGAVSGAAAVSGRHLFVQGLIVTIANPKSLIFIAAFLPQFIDTTRPPGLQFALILPTFLVITFSVTSVWAWAAGYLGAIIRERGALKPVFKAAGCLMIISGIGLALARRGS